ncbi:PYGO1 protein, partial [Polyodon spathula]|nr:PYGO1 protein [Polyodon spathula]
SSFPPLSEYAPPPNPSVDHLVAANPFDDSYNPVSYKPLPSGNPYFGNPNYSGFGGYNFHRMPPHMQPRMPSLYGGPYPMRNQPHPFPQMQVGMGFNHTHGFNFGPHDNPNFRNQPVFTYHMNSNMSLPPHPPFRPGPGENFNQMPLQNMNQNTNSDMGSNFGPESNTNMNPPMGPNMDGNHGFIQSHSSNHNQDLSNPKVTNKHSSPNQESSHSNTPENISGSHGNSSAQNKSHAAIEGVAAESSSSKTVAHPIQLSQSSANPVYPCGICMNEVNDDQEAILCEASCQKWFHRVCTGMTEMAYNLLTAEAAAVWGCDTCMENKEVQLTKPRQTSRKQ